MYCFSFKSSFVPQWLNSLCFHVVLAYLSLFLVILWLFYKELFPITFLNHDRLDVGKLLFSNFSIFVLVGQLFWCQTFFSVKGQIGNIFGFVGPRVFTTAQLHHRQSTNQWTWFASVKLYDIRLEWLLGMRFSLLLRS